MANSSFSTLYPWIYPKYVHTYFIAPTDIHLHDFRFVFFTKSRAYGWLVDHICLIFLISGRKHGPGYGRPPPAVLHDKSKKSWIWETLQGKMLICQFIQPITVLTVFMSLCWVHCIRIAKNQANKHDFLSACRVLLCINKTISMAFH